MYTTISIISGIYVAVLAYFIWRGSWNISDHLNKISGNLTSLGRKIDDTNKELSAIGKHLGVIARTLELKEENASEKPTPLTPLQVYALAYIASTCEELHLNRSIDLAYTTEAYLKQAIKRDDQHDLENVLRQCIALYVGAITKLVIENPAAQEKDIPEDKKERFEEDIAYLTDLHDSLKQLEASMEDYGKQEVRELYIEEIERLEKAGLIKPFETHAGDVLFGIVQAEYEWHIGTENKKNDAS